MHVTKFHFTTRHKLPLLVDSGNSSPAFTLETKEQSWRLQNGADLDLPSTTKSGTFVSPKVASEIIPNFVLLLQVIDFFVCVRFSEAFQDEPVIGNKWSMRLSGRSMAVFGTRKIN